ncbi:uncharacterized protein CLUP02_00026 [Colletotrichum lupini]|uniref:Uncharacterized protein n=1 Tax=Colletotrichum lupini TaxID=145971 RepID=A0A9Q8SBC3_9PEZI|nr:uncharacterized protein CLUP02_00026 [Colletotrichum lupini]UQC73382.1 hypothetical protein CLUP02_00026 [Colletotrichum lupini]
MKSTKKSHIKSHARLLTSVIIRQKSMIILTHRLRRRWKAPSVSGSGLRWIILNIYGNMQLTILSSDSSERGDSNNITSHPESILPNTMKLIENIREFHSIRDNFDEPNHGSFLIEGLHLAMYFELPAKRGELLLTEDNFEEEECLNFTNPSQTPAAGYQKVPRFKTESVILIHNLMQYVLVSSIHDALESRITQICMQQIILAKEADPIHELSDVGSFNNARRLIGDRKGLMWQYFVYTATLADVYQPAQVD